MLTHRIGQVQPRFFIQIPLVTKSMKKADGQKSHFFLKPDWRWTKFLGCKDDNVWATHRSYARGRGFRSSTTTEVNCHHCDLPMQSIRCHLARGTENCQNHLSRFFQWKCCPIPNRMPLAHGLQCVSLRTANTLVCVRVGSDELIVLGKNHVDGYIAGGWFRTQ
jgi:hypothetical protein